MNSSSVFFTSVTTNDPEIISKAALKLFTTFIASESVTLEKELPIKVHTGEPGNDTFIRPSCYDDVIDFLQKQGINTYFTETNVAYGGPRSTASSHLQVAHDHGFTKIPVVIADGDGFDHMDVPVVNGKHFKTCKIAKNLANKDQILVMTHFKGHVMAGFGGAIKMLGIGFASARGKSEIHSAQPVPEEKQMDWTDWKSETSEEHISFNPKVVHSGIVFYERVAESAFAASHGKHHIYLTFAISLTPDCDCDGKHMEPMYPNLGIFISLDPVAIDQAVFDMLENREKKIPFSGSEILPYAAELGIGNQTYTITTVTDK